MQTPIQERASRRTIPSRRGWQVALDLLTLRRDWIGGLDALRRKHGSAVYIRAGLPQFLMLTDPALLHEILVQRAKEFEKGRHADVVRDVTGLGLGTADNALNRTQRRLISPVFTRTKVACYADTMNACVARVLDTWTEGKVIDVTAESAEIALQIATQTMFGTEFAAADTAVVFEAVTTANEWLHEELKGLVHLPLGFPLPRQREVRRSLAALEAVLERVIAARRCDPTEHDDLLALLLSARDENHKAMTKQQLRDEIVTLLIAGHETIALALAWALHLISRHPDVRKALEAELDKLPPGPVTFERLPQLPYMAQVLKETLRLYPPLPHVSRRARRDISVGDVTLTKDQHVLCFIYGVHRNVSVYPDPERFDPERFSPEREALIPPGAYMPFGIGPRVCIGNHFAMMGATLALAQLVRSFRIEGVEGDSSSGFGRALTLRPLSPFKMTVRRRMLLARSVDRS
jgi:cytochrome P450